MSWKSLLQMAQTLQMAQIAQMAQVAQVLQMAQMAQMAEMAQMAQVAQMEGHGNGNGNGGHLPSDQDGWSRVDQVLDGSAHSGIPGQPVDENFVRATPHLPRPLQSRHTANPRI